MRLPEAGRLRRLAPLAILLLAPLLPLWRAVFLGEAIGPFDQIRAMPPWNGPAPAQPWDVLQADGALQFAGWRDLVFEAWRGGKLPFWNPYELCGTPLAANSQSAPFYPPHIAAGLVQVPTFAAITLLAWAHLAWAGLGLYALARSFGANRLGATVGGLSFTLSTFMLAWTALPSVISTVAWIPWCLWAVAMLARDQGRALLRTAQLGLCVGMMLLAGHLQFAAYGLMATALMLLAMPVAERSRGAFIRSWGGGLVGLLIGGSLSAIQLLPVLDYSRTSHRRNAASEDGYRAYLSGAIQPFEARNLLTPYALGNPRAYGLVEGMSGYWPPLAKPGANLAESALTITPLVAIFGSMAILRRPRRAVLPLLLALLGALIAFGSPLNRLLYFLAPGWSSTGSPGRAIVLSVMALCVTAAMGVPDRFEPLDRRALTLSLGVAALLSLAAFLMPGVASQGIGRPDLAPLAEIAASVALPGAMIALLVAVAACLATQVREGRMRIVVIAALPILALAHGASNLIPTGQPLARVQTDSTKRIAVVNDDWQIVTRPKATLPPNTATLLRQPEVGGYDSLISRETVELLRQINAGRDPAPQANGNMMFVKPGFDADRLAEAGVTEVWKGGERTPLAGPGIASTPQGPARIVAMDAQRIVVSATGPGRLTLRQRALPGWRAKVGRRELSVPESTWIEIELPAGEQVVTFIYEPPQFQLGAVASVIATTLLFSLAAVSYMRKRQQPAPI